MGTKYWIIVAELVLNKFGRLWKWNKNKFMSNWVDHSWIWWTRKINDVNLHLL